jgi:hypothetical protein
MIGGLGSVIMGRAAVSVTSADRAAQAGDHGNLTGTVFERSLATLTVGSRYKSLYR